MYLGQNMTRHCDIKMNTCTQTRTYAYIQTHTHINVYRYIHIHAQFLKIRVHTQRFSMVTICYHDNCPAADYKIQIGHLMINRLSGDKYQQENRTPSNNKISTCTSGEFCTSNKCRHLASTFATGEIYRLLQHHADMNPANNS